MTKKIKFFSRHELNTDQLSLVCDEFGDDVDVVYDDTHYPDYDSWFNAVTEARDEGFYPIVVAPAPWCARAATLGGAFGIFLKVNPRGEEPTKWEFWMI